MELFLVLLFFVAFCTMIYRYAVSKGREPWAWTIAAIIFSPLLVGIIMLFVPKTIEKQAEEANLLKSLMS